MSIFKKETNMLETELADQMLQNVFDICKVEPYSVPLEDLESYSNYRKDKFRLQKFILVLIFILFLATPLLFMAPEIQVIDAPSDKSNDCTIRVDSFLPITSVTATVNGNNVPVYETEPRVYSIQPDYNGEMLVTVTAVNHQYVQEFFNVKNVDKDSPTLISHKKVGNEIQLYVKDADSGIAYKEVYASNSSGDIIKPKSYDSSKGLIVFSYPKKSVNVFIPDKNGNVLQLVLTVQ